MTRTAGGPNAIRRRRVAADIVLALDDRAGALPILAEDAFVDGIAGGERGAGTEIHRGAGPFVLRRVSALRAKIPRDVDACVPHRFGRSGLAAVFRLDALKKEFDLRRLGAEGMRVPVVEHDMVRGSVRCLHARAGLLVESDEVVEAFLPGRSANQFRRRILVCGYVAPSWKLESPDETAARRQEAA